jgi:nucleoside-diphosphate-sugar epimerase
LVAGNQGISYQPAISVTSIALVTGAYGFVGVRLCKLLVERDWRVVAGHRGHASPADLSGVTPAFLPLLSEPDRWHHSLQSIECVVHLAAQVHQMRHGRAEDAAYEEINVGGSRFVAEQAARAGVKRFVLLSSAKVNGEGSNSRSYRAEDPTEPRDAYARSKASAEVMIREICGRTGMEFVIVRPPLVYGPGVRANFHRLLKLAESGWPLPLSSIANRRSLVGAGNLADFIATCMTHPQAAGRVWMVTDDEDVSTPDLIRRSARFMRRPARLFPCPPAILKMLASLIGHGAEAARLCDSFVLDAAPARDILRWKPPMSVDEELERTVADYMARRKG